MKGGRIGFLLGGLIVLTACGSAWGQAWTWSHLDFPGASWTGVSGVCDGTIVGGYVGSDSVGHGFVYDGVTWRTLDYPGAASSGLAGVSGSNFLGRYKDTSGQYHNFVYDGTSWSTFDYPGAYSTYARGISGRNVVGYYEDAPWVDHGFLYDGLNWAPLDCPSARPGATSANGIYGSTIVGSYVDSYSRVRGFIFDGVMWTPVSVPYAGGVTDTILWGIWENRVVGTWSDYYDRRLRGLLVIGGNLNYLDCPWGRETEAYGISGNQIVGQYNDGTGYRSFLLTIPEPACLALLALACAAVGARRRRRG